MPFDGHKNFAYTTVAVAPAPSNTGTTMSVRTGDGTLLPAAPFNAVVWAPLVLPLPGNAEIVRVTAVAGDNLTVVRAQEGSTARQITTGDQFSAAITAKTLTDIEALVASALQGANNLSDVASASQARVNLGLGSAAVQDVTAFDSAGAAAAEATARANAITTEASTRAAADTSEASTRAAADTSEATARANADSAHAALTTSVHGIADTSKLATLLAVATTATTAGALAVGKLNPVDATTGPLTMTLPAGQASGAVVQVEKEDTSTNAVTVSGNIRGVAASTLTLALAKESIELVADATGSWWPLAGHKTLTSLDTRYLGAGATEIVGGNLGATPTLALAGVRDVFFTGTLTANATITVTGLSAGAHFRLLLTQDATGGRTATLSDGTNTLALNIPTAASTSALVDCWSPNGTDIVVAGG